MEELYILCVLAQLKGFKTYNNIIKMFITCYQLYTYNSRVCCDIKSHIVHVEDLYL